MTAHSTAEVLFGLETPYPLRPSQNYVRLEGWALIAGSSQPTETRLRVGKKIFAPDSRPVRTDVAERFSFDPNAADSGFIFICYLPFGNHLGHLEASGDGGASWHLVKSMMMPVSSHPLLGKFESAGELGRITHEIRLAGWCWHPEQKVEKVAVLMGDIAVPTEYGLERPDVVSRFPEQPAAKFSGFMTRENLPRGRGEVRLQVETSCGRIYFLDSELKADIEEGAFLASRQVGNLWQLPPAKTKVSPPTPRAPTPAGRTNILFVLFGDFTSNSAYHVTALANEMIAMGYDCVVAVPDHIETIEAQPSARFLPITFSEIGNLAGYFRDNRGPAVTHVWTPREGIREIWQDIQQRFSTDLMIHLEDNERELLRDHLSISSAEFDELSTEDFDNKVPLSLSHPHRAHEFLSSAQGVTTIIASLQQHVPENIPTTTFWPAATDAFRPKDINLPLRRKLGILDSDTVVFYHGNVHAANEAEMLELYRGIDELNHQGHPTWLLRTGRDSESFERAASDLLADRLVHIGFVKRAKDLPNLMSAANVFVQPGAPGAFNNFRFPSKLPEFFAIGRPVVLPASNLAQFLEHRKHACILDDANAVAIAAAIREICQESDLAKTLGEGALAFAREHFSWESSAKTLRDFYLENTRLDEPSARESHAVALINSFYS